MPGGAHDPSEPGPILIGAPDDRAAPRDFEDGRFEPGPIEFPPRAVEAPPDAPLVIPPTSRGAPRPSLAAPLTAMILVGALLGGVTVYLRSPPPIQPQMRAALPVGPKADALIGPTGVPAPAVPSSIGAAQTPLPGPRATTSAGAAPTLAAEQSEPLFAEEPPAPPLASAGAPVRAAIPKLDPVRPVEGGARQEDPAARLRLDQAAVRLQLAYDRAMASAPDRALLHDDQTRWLAEHPPEVDADETRLSEYEARITQLETQARQQRGPGLLRRLMR